MEPARGSLPDPATSNQGFVWPATVSAARRWRHLRRLPLATRLHRWRPRAPDGVSGQTFVVRYNNDISGEFSNTAAFGPGASDVTFNVQTVKDANGNVIPAPRTIPGTIFLTQGSAQPWVLTDPARPGNVYVVAADDPNNGAGGDVSDVVFARSTDSGATWTTSTIEAGTPLGNSGVNSYQLFPTATIDQSGDLAVAWLDNRDLNVNSNGHYLWDVYAKYSTDGGLTWSKAFQVNSTHFDPEPSPTLDADPATTRIGEYFGIAMSNGLAYVDWNGNTFDQQRRAQRPAGLPDELPDQRLDRTDAARRRPVAWTDDRSACPAARATSWRSWTTAGCRWRRSASTSAWATTCGASASSTRARRATSTTSRRPSSATTWTFTSPPAAAASSSAIGLEDLDNIAGNVNIFSGFGFGSTLTVLDANDPFAGDTWTITRSTIERFGAGAINYDGMDSLGIRGGDLGAIYNVLSTEGATTTSLVGGNSFDEFNVRATTGPLTIDGTDSGGNLDGVNVGSLAPALGGTMAGITGDAHHRQQHEQDQCRPGRLRRHHRPHSDGEQQRGHRLGPSGDRLHR